MRCAKLVREKSPLLILAEDVFREELKDRVPKGRFRTKNAMALEIVVFTLVVVFTIHTDSLLVLHEKQHLQRLQRSELLLPWRQIWRVAGRESGSPELLGSPPTSPEVPRTSPEVFRRLPRRFCHCGTKQQSRGSPEVSRTSPEVSQTSPEVPGLPRRSAPFSGKPDTLS